MTSTPPARLSSVPVIDVAPLAGALSERRSVAQRIGDACRAHGFFYVTGHGVDPALMRRLEDLSREFFARDLSSKRRISMARGGRAWRGYFAVGDELTSGVPDRKEGLYLGTELPPEHPLVRARTPMHGPNLFPDLPGFRETVLAYLDAVTSLGHRLVAAIALSLELDEDYFARSYTAEPLVLFRIFNYPAPTPDSVGLWGVGEHTDYGLLTLLLQDENDGLEIRTDAGWIDAKPLAGLARTTRPRRLLPSPVKIHASHS